MPDLLQGDDFTRLFETFRVSAVRLEVRRSYGVAEEDEAYAAFLDGKEPDLRWFMPWLELMSSRTSAGAYVRRVRLIDDPPSDYLRFELWGTPLNLSAGEDIRYLPHKTSIHLGLPDYDFWVFDGTDLAILHFDDQGDRFLGAELRAGDVGVLREHLDHFEAAWSASVRYHEYLAQRQASTQL